MGALAAPLAGLNIVTADDDMRMRQFYLEVLRRLGHSVVTSAADGRELVEACLSHNVDLVITDVKMPNLSGIEAAHLITAETALPFVFVSAYHDEELISDASMRFSYGYLVKPIKQEDLAALIPIAISRFREQEAS